MSIWFSNHCYDRTNLALLATVNQYAKAKKPFLNHWCNQKIVINTARCKICVGRTVKTEQEIMGNEKLKKQSIKN